MAHPHCQQSCHRNLVTCRPASRKQKREKTETRSSQNAAATVWSYLRAVHIFWRLISAPKSRWRQGQGDRYRGDQADGDWVAQVNEQTARGTHKQNGTNFLLAQRIVRTLLAFWLPILTARLPSHWLLSWHLFVRTPAGQLQQARRLRRVNVGGATRRILNLRLALVTARSR